MLPNLVLICILVARARGMGRSGAKGPGNSNRTLQVDFMYCFLKETDSVDEYLLKIFKLK